MKKCQSFVDKQLTEKKKKKTPVRLHMPAGREYQGRHKMGKARSVGSGGIRQREGHGCVLFRIEKSGEAAVKINH